MLKLIKFGLVGASGSVILLGITYLLTEYAGLFYLISYAVGFFSAVINNYFLNTRWTFGQIVNFRDFSRYLLICMFTITINELLVWYLTDKVGIYYILSAAIGILTAFFINYSASRRLVWVKSQA